jgi:GDP-L-fucose synthase
MSDFFENKRVVVTGGTGFVGSYFVEQLLDLGAHVVVPVHERPMTMTHERIETIPCDLENEDDALAVCQGADCVIHCAGPVGAAGIGPEKLMHGISRGLSLLMKTLHAAWAGKAGRVLIFGSSTGYPPLDHPVKEEEFWTGDVYPGYFGYGWMRRYMERVGEFMQRDSETDVTIIRPVAIYGPRDNFDPKTCHGIPALINRAVAGEDPFVVWGRADVVRDFLHVKDFVRGCLLALEKLPGADPVNIAYGKQTTVGEVVEAILKAAGREDAVVEYDETKPTALPFRMADTTKAREVLGFEPSISLEQGLADTVNWYKNQGDK